MRHGYAGIVSVRSLRDVGKKGYCDWSSHWAAGVFSQRRKAVPCMIKVPRDPMRDSRGIRIIFGESGKHWFYERRGATSLATLLRGNSSSVTRLKTGRLGYRTRGRRWCFIVVEAFQLQLLTRYLFDIVIFASDLLYYIDHFDI
jgi:hypothetical protein